MKGECDLNLISALGKMGKVENSDAVLTLRRRFQNLLLNRYWDKQCVSSHLKTLASIDDEGWSSFPFLDGAGHLVFSYYPQQIVYKRGSSDLINRDSPNADSTIAFANALKPCERAPISSYCPSGLELDYRKTKVIDAWTVELSGRITESPRIMQPARDIGTFVMTLKRTAQSPHDWLIYKLNRQN